MFSESANQPFFVTQQKVAEALRKEKMEREEAEEEELQKVFESVSSQSSNQQNNKQESAEKVVSAVKDRRKTLNLFYGTSVDDGDEETYLERLREWKKWKKNQRKKNKTKQNEQENSQREKKEEEEEEVEEVEEEEEDVLIDGKFKLPSSLWDQLYRYQQNCVKWFWKLFKSEVGGICADEM